MKIMTILGTRPEIIRLSIIMKKLDAIGRHVIVHTGQNYDENLNGIFWEQLGLRLPDHFIESKSDSFGGQVGKILEGCEKIMRAEHPDRILVLGDTNSGLAVMVANRLGIPVYHMEAGNRCHDDSVPEERNRKVIDHASHVNMPYTQNSKKNLMLEGVPVKNILVTGNPILEVLNHYSKNVSVDESCKKYGVNDASHVLVTVHRSETVDVPQRLQIVCDSLSHICDEYPEHKMIMSVHPRTRDRIEKMGIKLDYRIILSEPMGFFDFLALEKSADLVITDSGTVQEECCLFGVPTVTVRDSTERPETLECGSNIISGIDRESIVRCAKIMMGGKRVWTVPSEYSEIDVSDKIIKIIHGKL